MTSELVGGGFAGGGVGEGGGGGGSRATPPSPGTPKKGGKMMAVRVQMLDDSVTMFQVQAKAVGRVLFDQVCKQLNLLEADYFGLEYQELHGTRYWLDLEKPVSRQVGLSLPECLLRFCVKFYTPDPAQLEEEFTRYLFCLQVKRDLAQGLILCNDNTAALMASYIVQAECGDYVVEDYPDHTYLSTYKFVPHQDAELERRIMENHKKHAGQSPAEADLNLLETARRCELYGMKMHPAKDHEGVPLNLAVAHMGIVVFQNFTKINTFSWAKIRKISFKRKRFLVKLHPEGYGYYKDTVEFFFEGRNECKNFWKKCVEHHGFFRCSTIKNTPRQKKRVLSRGSSFRYSGKTQKQIVEYVRENYVKRQTFHRSQSFRHSSSVHSSVANVGTSISAHPLLPLGDNAVVGTPASLSCGSMTLGSLEEALPQSPGAVGGGGSADFDTTAREVGQEDEEVYEEEEEDGEECYRVGGARAGDTPSLATTSRQDTLSPPTSLASSPQHHYPQVIGPLHHPGMAGVQQMQRGGGTSTYDDPEECAHLRRDEEEEEDDDEDEDATVPAGRPIPVQQRRLQEKETSPIVPPRPSMEAQSTDRKVNGTHSNSIKSPNSPVSPLATSPINKTPPVVSNHTSQMVQVCFHSPVGLQSSATISADQKDESTGPTTSPPLLMHLSKASGQPDSDGDVRRKKFPTDRSYYIAKEMLMTERTYKKDLEVINLWFREEVTKEEEAMPDEALDFLFKLIDPLLDAHINFLREVELRLAAWEGRTNALHKSESQKIGDVMLKGMISLLPLYHDFLGKHLHVLEQLDLAFRKNRKFEQLYRDFEQQKICYLPITSFVLKPLQRLLHYQSLLNRIIKHYGKEHPDYTDCCAAQEKLSEVVANVPDILRASENFVQLCELQRDIVGLDSPLVVPGRQFVRQGCLIKISPKALQQRMFFLFSDMLLYTNRGQHPSMQFKLHGQWPLNGLTVVESGTADESSPLVAAHSFTIYGVNRSLRVAAHGQEEKDKWLEDLYTTIQAARERGASSDGLHYHSLKSCSSSDEVLDKSGVTDSSSPGGLVTSPTQTPSPVVTSPSAPTTSPTQRSNTTVHVCWHRNTSIGMNDQMRAVENQLSGYLLRKFKNSNGWQKLWVVFANFCLFFYKNFQDDFPLASLPLLGYYASSPSPSDNILKDFVFKLQFKNHVYFFRAESEYTFERWMEVISSATQHAGRHRLFSRKDSAQNNGEDSINVGANVQFAQPLTNIGNNNITITEFITSSNSLNDTVIMNDVNMASF